MNENDIRETVERSGGVSDLDEVLLNDNAWLRSALSVFYWWWKDGKKEREGLARQLDAARAEIKGLRRGLPQARKARLEELLEVEASERVEIEQRPAKGEMRESAWFRCDKQYASAWGDKMDYVSIPGWGFRECEEIEDFICCLYAVLAEKRRREADHG